jgi:hypothetical protein
MAACIVKNKIWRGLTNPHCEIQFIENLSFYHHLEIHGIFYLTGISKLISFIIKINEVESHCQYILEEFEIEKWANHKLIDQRN